MTVRILLFVGLGFLSSAGCLYRHTDVTLLENELRWMEDQLYRMEDELQAKQRQLAECQTQARCDSIGTYTICDDGPLLDTGPGTSGGGTSVTPYEIVPSDGATSSSPRQEPTPARPPADSSPGYEILDQEEPPRFAPDRATKEPPAELDLDPGQGAEPLDDESTKDGDTLAPPDVTLPPDSPDAEHLRPGADDESHSAPTPGAPDEIALSSHREVESDESLESVDTYVTHVVVKAWLAHGQGFDDRERDVDLLVLVEPRNADGHAVSLGAPLSLVVLDASKTGEDSRIARWDYTAAEARRLLRRSSAGHGIHLELPWPDLEHPPAGGDLYVFARYTTVENHVLQADTHVEERYQGPDPVLRAGWQRARRGPRRSETRSEETDLLQRVPSKIRLRPIPKPRASTAARESSGEDARGTEGDAAPAVEQPTLLPDDDDVPSWQPER